MPQGLQVRDASGILTLNITDRLTRILGRVEGNTTTPTSGTITIPSDFLAGGDVFFLLSTPTGTWRQVGQDKHNDVSVNGGTITYKNLVSSFYYGVY